MKTFTSSEYNVFLTETISEVDFFTEKKKQVTESGNVSTGMGMGDIPTSLYMKGITIQAEVINGNKRKYTFDACNEAVKKYTPKIQFRTATGELNHPEENVTKINPDRISHRFVEAIRDGNNWITKAQILDTKCGIQVRKLIEGGVRLGMSSRGLGKSTTKNGIANISKLHLITMADIVVDPSAPDAWQEAVFENQQWVFDIGDLVGKDTEPIMDNVKKALNNFSEAKRTEIVLEEFKNFLKTISGQ